MDDNMTSVMFLGQQGKELDFHYLLWDFDTEKLYDTNKAYYNSLMTIDSGKVPGINEEDDDDENIDDETKEAV